MHDHINDEARGTDRTDTADAPPAEMSGVPTAAVHADADRRAAESDGGSPNVLYGRAVSGDETDGTMSPDPADDDGSGVNAPVVEGDDRRPDGGDENAESDSPGGSGGERSGRVRTRVRDENGEGAERADDETERADESERTESGPHMSHCPECGGRIVDDSKHGEKACNECGLVVEEREIDHGPEWRSFNQEETNERRRVGSPSTLLQHDKGLSTNIGWEDKDGYGRTLSPRQRRRMSRLRTWNERFRARDSDDRNLKKALGNIKRIKSELDLAPELAESASGIYRKCLDEDLIRGRAIEAMSEASVWIAIRQAELPRTLDELAKVSQVERQRIARAQRYISRELEVEITPPNPTNFVEMIGSSVDAPIAVRELGRAMVEELVETGAHSGKHPVGIASAAVYAADEQIADGELTQQQVAEVVDITEVTVRNRKKDLIEAANPETVEEYRERYAVEKAEQPGRPVPSEREVEAQPESATDAGTDGDADAEDEDGRANAADDADVGEGEEDGGGSEREGDDGTAEARAAITVDFADDDRTQSEAMLQGAQRLVDDHGLLAEIGDEFVPPRCQNPLILAEDEIEDKEYGTWHDLGARMCLNTKLNTRDKKTRLQQLGDVCDVDVEIRD